MAQNKRLDVALFEQNFTDSRAKAGALIMAGQVYVNGQKITKAGYALKDTDKIEVRGEKLPFVSRGGLKLNKAMKAFDIRLTDLFVWISALQRAALQIVCSKTMRQRSILLTLATVSLRGSFERTNVLSIWNVQISDI